MNLSLDTIFAILKQIVIDMGKDPALQLNTFTQVDDLPDMGSETLGKTYEDFEHGYFWSRSWVNGGALRNEIKAEYPVVLAELRNSRPVSLTDDRDRHEIALVFVDKIDCPTCPKSAIRTGPVVYNNLRRMARAMLVELANYKLYEVTRETTTYEWASDGRVALWEADGLEYVEQDDMFEVIDERGIEMRKWGNRPGYRGLLVVVPFLICERSGIVFRYDSPVAEALASNDCPC